MEFVRTLETKLASWYKGLPHLPKGGQKWLAENVWWLVIVGIALGAFGLFGIFAVLFLAGAGITAAGGALGGGVGAAAGAALGGVVILSSLVLLAVYIIQIILMALAISPLKDFEKKGWTLLFLVALVNAGSAIVTGLLSMNLFSIVFDLLFAAIGAYFLFEIRSYFEPAKVVKKKPEATTDKKEIKE